MKIIFLLLTLYAIYRIYQDSNYYIQYILLWVHQNHTMAMLLIGIICIYLFTYQQELVYEGSSLLYDMAISKQAKIGYGTLNNIRNNMGSIGGTKKVKRSVSGLLK